MILLNVEVHSIIRILFINSIIKIRSVFWRPKSLGVDTKLTISYKSIVFKAVIFLYNDFIDCII